MTRTVTWLHLSDLHACEPKTGWDAARVLKTLIKDLKEMEQDHGLTPDLIFFTGDAAFGHIGTGAGQTITEQFSLANDFLEGVRGAFRAAVPKENVFVVPGNHDVHREFATEAETLWLETANLEKVTGMVKAGGVQWRRIAERLGAYKDFLSTHGYGHLLADPSRAQRLMFAVRRRIPSSGIDLGIAGLNSSWSCGRDKERGRLWMAGNWQMATVAPELEGAEIKIALMHHPPSWLSEFEGSDVEREIQRDFDFLLHGHEHQGWVNESVEGHVRIGAAACYDRSTLENGYSFVRLQLDSPKSGEIWLRRYDRDGGGWTPRAIHRKTDANGCWRIWSRTRIAPDTRPLAGNVAGLFEELAKAYGGGRLAELFLIRVGFPQLQLPVNARTSAEFWGEVKQKLEGGVLEDGLVVIVMQAKQEFPANRTFRAFGDTLGEVR
jgi:predicted MPP superfamily phosphohydrolase